ncbi:MAG: diaminobutyrate acetyltransferase [Alphaproteobacteria bacterium]|nr:diaminobutyrate acetyltransferase [Alphaproteobacteria bacterium]
MSRNLKIKNHPDSGLSIRAPLAKDGKALYQMAKNAGGLDVNAEYAYLLLGAHFSNTCAVALEDEEILGFVSAYRLPDRPDTLFIWQVSIDPQHRKRGLAKTMIRDILNRDICQAVRHLQASITPSNTASQNLFASLARDLECQITKLPFFDATLFSESHEEEFLVHIGPFF